jgi:tRNA(Ile)-lysidine synthase
MKEKLVQVVKEFLEERGGGKLLLGVSGGPDSMALLHLILECCRFVPLEIEIAHVDHRWREASTKQAEILARLAQELQLPFHLHTSSGKSAKNSEERARDERYTFFKEVYGKIGAGALVLGHQRDDQSETVLKRIFEGADFAALAGMGRTSLYEGMSVWRPLLGVSKRELEDYMAGRWSVDDETNRDPAYLRARLRTEIIPALSKSFGKEVGGNLSRLADRAQQMADYLDRRVAPLWNAVREEEGELTIDFNPFLPLESLEFTTFLKQILKRGGHSATQHQLENLQKEVVKKKFKLLSLGQVNLRVGCGKLGLKREV